MRRQSPHALVRPPLLIAGVLLSLAGRSQTDCSDLSIISVRYAAFADTALEVEVLNAGASFFSYPSFSLVNTDQDTLARETVNFFGLGTGEQRHRMDLLPGAEMPSTPFTGELVLDFAFADGDSLCTFALNAMELCPPPPCAILVAYVYSAGASPTTSFTWSISDNGNNVVGSGEWSLDAGGTGSDQDSLCLPPGTYELHVVQTSAAPGTFYFGVRDHDFMNNGPAAVFDAGLINHLPFPFHSICAPGTNVIEETPADDPLLLSVQHGSLHITSADGRPIGAVEVFDANGRSVGRIQAFGSTAVLDMRAQASGIHLVHFLDQPHRSAQRFILHNDQ